MLLFSIFWTIVLISSWLSSLETSENDISDKLFSVFSILISIFYTSSEIIDCSDWLSTIDSVDCSSIIWIDEFTLIWL